MAVIWERLLKELSTMHAALVIFNDVAHFRSGLCQCVSGMDSGPFSDLLLLLGRFKIGHPTLLRTAALAR